MESGTSDLAVNDLPFGGNRWDPKNVVHIRRQTRVLVNGKRRLSLVQGDRPDNHSAQVRSLASLGITDYRGAR